MCNNIDSMIIIVEIHYCDMINLAIIIVYKIRHLSLRVAMKFEAFIE